MEYNFKVKKSERGVSLENFLHGKMDNWSHRQVKQAIDHKRVFVNNRNIFIGKWNLKPGDNVRFQPVRQDYPKAPLLLRYHYIEVIYEDDVLLVTDKPAFVDYDSYVDQVNAYLKRQKQGRFYPYLGQMHRLDKETSGLLTFTKKKSANILADDFRGRRVKKFYLALVEGRVDKDHGVITERLEKGHFGEGRKARVVIDAGEGKESFTEYWVKERYDNATLLRIRIGTGRTHQIRVHMANLGHPVVGDKLYGEISNPKSQNPKSSIRRQALHAHEMEFLHPITRKKLHFTAPIPKDMAHLIDQLRQAV